MEKRIELERRGKSPDEVTELILDNSKSSSVVGLSEQWKSLESLSLMNVGLTTLKEFPKLPSLIKLELSDNCISGGLHHLNVLPNLNYLGLSNNKISDLEPIKALTEMKSLNHLDLSFCGVSNIDDYRVKVFNLIPQLVYLDGYDREDVEIEDEDEVGLESAKNGQQKDQSAVVNGRRISEVQSDEESDEEEEEEEEERGGSFGKVRGKNGGDELEEEEETEGLDEGEESDLDDELEEEEESGEELEDVPLGAIYDTYDPEDDGDYEGQEDEEGSSGRGKKRKFEE